MIDMKTKRRNRKRRKFRRTPFHSVLPMMNTGLVIIGEVAEGKLVATIGQGSPIVVNQGKQNGNK